MADTQYQYYESKFTGQEIDDNLTLVKDNMNDLLEKVGNTEKGLVKDVADLKNKVDAGTGGANSADVEAIKTAIGMPYTPPEVGGQKQSIVDRIEALELYKGDSEISAGLITDVSTLKTDVSTLKTDVSTLKNQVGEGPVIAGSSSIYGIVATGEGGVWSSDHTMYQRLKMKYYAHPYSPLADQEDDNFGIGGCYYQVPDDEFCRINDADGVIEILKNGWYLVSGSIYCTSLSSEDNFAQATIFVDKANSSQPVKFESNGVTYNTYAEIYSSENTEDSSTWKLTYTNSQTMDTQLGKGQRSLRFVTATNFARAGSYSIPMKFIPLYAGDTIQMKVKVSDGGSVNIQTDNHSTQITLVKLV